MAEKTVPAAAAPSAPAQTSPGTATAPASNERANTTREPTRSEATFIPPAVDIYEDDHGLVLVADLPGVDPTGLEVRVDRGILTIQGKATHLAPGNTIYREYELTGFYRQFQLPEEIDMARIPADIRNGVLTVRLPRAEHAQPRRIQVRAS